MECRRTTRGVNSDKFKFSKFISFDDGARFEIMNKPGMVDADKHLNRIRGIIA